MPTARTYTVKLIPAEIGPGTIKFQPTDPRAVSVTIEAFNLPQMQANDRELARVFGQSCAVFVSLPRGERKPAGFDAACKEVERIEFKPAT